MDREVDPKIAESFFRANAKAYFPTLWISDVLDTQREEHTISMIEEMIRNLDRQMANLGSQDTDKFVAFIESLEKPDETQQLINCGVYPRRFLNLFSDSKDEDELFKVFEPMEVISAAIPFDQSLVYTSHDFGYDGKFFIVRYGLPKDSFFTQIAIGNSGEIIFSLGAGREEANEIYMSTVKQAITPTFKLCSNVFRESNYDGMVEIITSLTGLKDMQWIAENQGDRLSRIIRGRRFYADKVNIPLQSFNANEIFSDDMLKKFFLSCAIQHPN